MTIRNGKRIFSLLFAFALLFSLSATGFADGGPGAAGAAEEESAEAVGLTGEGTAEGSEATPASEPVHNVTVIAATAGEGNPEEPVQEAEPEFVPQPEESANPAGVSAEQTPESAARTLTVQAEPVGTDGDASEQTVWSRLLWNDLTGQNPGVDPGSAPMTLTLRGAIPDSVTAAAEVIRFTASEQSGEALLFSLLIRLTDADGQAWSPEAPMELSIRDEQLHRAADSGYPVLVYTENFRDTRTSDDGSGIRSSIQVRTSPDADWNSLNFPTENISGARVIVYNDAGDLSQDSDSIRFQIDFAPVLMLVSAQLPAGESAEETAETAETAASATENGADAEQAADAQTDGEGTAGDPAADGQNADQTEASGTADGTEPALNVEEADWTEEGAETTLSETVTASDGQSYEITVRYGLDAGFPETVTLRVNELTGEAYEEYLNQTAAALGIDRRELSYARAFDISLVGESGTVYEPNGDVAVSIRLMDVAELTDAQVVHFGEETSVLDAATEAGGGEVTVGFETGLY